ncbi:site-specific integrase [Psychromonas sp. KJ10-2]|uniref:site-specific integrase n=1 Tax=Psychromonas sp. KJ10-2 TaxID=3391822 RepID=UPI0039B3C285
MLKLQWQDIDFKNQTAYLYDTKNGDDRVLPLTVECLEELKQFKQSTGFIFPHHENPSAHLVNFDNHWRKCLRLAKIEGLRFHDLRHTCGSWLAMNDVPLKAIAEILGHKTIQTTQRYVHHSTSHKASHLNRVFGGIV